MFSIISRQKLHKCDPLVWERDNWVLCSSYVFLKFHVCKISLKSSNLSAWCYQTLKIHSTVCLCILVGSCFVVQYLASILILQLSCLGRDSWLHLLYFICLLDVMCLIIFFVSSLPCCGLVCCVWLLYFLVILTFFGCHTRFIL